jgi:hypothetical protein
MYSDHQRAAQYADARSGGALTDSLSKPVASAASSAPPADGSSSPDSASPSNASHFTGNTQNSGQEKPERSASAGPYISPSSQSAGFEAAVNSGRTAAMNASQSAARAQEIIGAKHAKNVSEAAGSWGSYASDTKNNEGERTNGQ